MTALEILVSSRRLIQDPANWCQEFYARDENDNLVGITDPAACRWCARGAIKKVAIDAGVDVVPAFDAMYSVVPQISWDDNSSLVDLNDRLGHEAVLKCFDAAIATLEQETK